MKTMNRSRLIPTPSSLRPYLVINLSDSWLMNLTMFQIVMQKDSPAFSRPSRILIFLKTGRATLSNKAWV